MAEKRTLTSDFQKNILDKIGKEDITKGDARGYGKQVEGGVSTYEINKDVLPKRPYNVYPKKNKKPIEYENDFERVFNQALIKAYENKKLPVRYTKEGLLNLGLTFAMPGVAAEKIELEKRAQIKSGKKREYIEGYTDIASGILRGGPNFVRSAGEFVLAPIDRD